MTDTTHEPLAAASGTFEIGGQLTVHRLGFGAMQLTGEGIWASPAIPRSAGASSGAPSSSG